MTGARGINGTQYHHTLTPRDDRPSYLMGDNVYTIAVDTETTGLDWHENHRPFLATISDYDRDWVFRLDRPMERKQLRDAILSAPMVIAHNLSFDAHMLAAEGIVTIDELLDREVRDTKVEAQVILGEGNMSTESGVQGFRLKDLATALLDPEAGSYERKVKAAMKEMGLLQRADQEYIPDGAYYEVWKAYPELLEEYAWKDTRYTYDLYHLLQLKANDNHRRILENIERRVTPTLIRMEHVGIALDSERVDELYVEAIDELGRLTAALYGFNDGEWDINKRDETVAYLERNGVVLIDRTKTGEVRIDKGILSRHAGNPAVDALMDYRVQDKLLSTYLGPMKGKDELHTSFMQTEAWTGRMSSRRPNLQNLPVRRGPELRSTIVPREGFAFVQADYGQIEFRLLAYYMDDDELKAKIARGNPFRELGAVIYGTPDESKWAVAYSNLKNGYYSLIYGAGGPKLASTIGGGMTDDEGRALAKQLKAALGPKYGALNRRISGAVKGKGYVVTIGGRIQRIDRSKAYVGLSGLIQGSAADVMKLALRDSEDALRAVGGRPLLVVHDEILAEVPLGQEEEGLDILTRTMQNAQRLDPKRRLELAVEGKVCYLNYGEAK